MDCLENAGRMRADVYQRATIYSTLSPCAMCTGAILLYGIPRLVVGENQTFQGPQHLLEDAGVEVTLVNDERCINMMLEFIAAEPGLWNEDIGEL
jgi:cytosine deaminase